MVEGYLRAGETASPHRGVGLLTLTTPDLIGLTLGRVGSRTHPYALSCLSARRAVAAAQQQYPRAGGLGNM